MSRDLVYNYYERGFDYQGLIFVFGSNLGGYHGAGAAKEAHHKFGAFYHKAEGLQGQSYGIPTKDRQLRTLDVAIIEKAIDRFIAFTHSHPNDRFYVTPVGTGLAGLSHNAIAPLFRGAQGCWFPRVWEPYLEPRSPVFCLGGLE